MDDLRYGRLLTQVSLTQTDNVLARFINGFGTGILNTIVPVWATEVADHTSRGQFIAIEFTLNIFGVALAYWLELYVYYLRLPIISLILLSGLSFIDGGRSAFRWRFPIAFQLIFLLVLFTLVWFCPESPRWLVKANREQEARYILGRLRGSTGEDAIRAEAEFQDIQGIIEMEKSVNHNYSYLGMLFDHKRGKLHLGRRVQLAAWLQIMQEWVGIAGVTVCMVSYISRQSLVLTLSRCTNNL